MELLLIAVISLTAVFVGCVVLLVAALLFVHSARAKQGAVPAGAVREERVDDTPIGSVIIDFAYERESGAERLPPELPELLADRLEELTAHRSTAPMPVASSADIVPPPLPMPVPPPDLEPIPELEPTELIIHRPEWAREWPQAS